MQKQTKMKTNQCRLLYKSSFCACSLLCCNWDDSLSFWNLSWQPVVYIGFYWIIENCLNRGRQHLETRIFWILIFHLKFVFCFQFGSNLIIGRNVISGLQRIRVVRVVRVEEEKLNYSLYWENVAINFKILLVVILQTRKCLEFLFLPI